MMSQRALIVVKNQMKGGGSFRGERGGTILMEYIKKEGLYVSLSHYPCSIALTSVI